MHSCVLLLVENSKLLAICSDFFNTIRIYKSILTVYISIVLL